MKSRFNYLLEKVEKAPFIAKPFRHLEIFDFLSDNDFNEVVQSNEINIKSACSDEKLFDALFEAGYKMVPFPGAITDHKEYIRKRKSNKKVVSHSACESAGVVLRLVKPSSPVLIELKSFIESDLFNECLAKKFGINYNSVKTDSGIQKYLDEYEISPHPDMRKKALTFMVNINNSEQSESKNHHTHYMTFKQEKAYVSEFWKYNDVVERCWVPWDWCKTVKQQKTNNSIVIFAPGNDTLHAIKADYEHFTSQRTQLYGNLWYDDFVGATFKRPTTQIEWERLDIVNSFNPTKPQNSLANRLSNKIRKSLFGSSSSKIEKSRSDNY